MQLKVVTIPKEADRLSQMLWIFGILEMHDTDII